MKIHYLQQIEVKNYALIGKLWEKKGWFEYGGVIGTRKNGKECFESVELEVGDKIYLGLNKKPSSERSPLYLLYVKKGKLELENQVKLDLSKS